MKLTLLYLLASIVQAIQDEIYDGVKEQDDSAFQFVRNDDLNNIRDRNNQNEGEELPITSEENMPRESEEDSSDTSVENTSLESEEDFSDTSDENSNEKNRKESN
ncbi:hypothetical protein NBO_2g0062 [Nosema bombycis CQ1]|uniref:Secreted protein n=1 Tax=Nosema bombycis (strain CQ1 / CVCC 102059) TaxID=578461 RepID=R0KXE4_NOSB1|nr:hypothetical protein NBO_2g0062 [Nosema bombycis CQ1]|eukprot:EOB15571.1 hypothetical protein NBO_2g0062 [Nosema bombycis CQ1]